jgi:ABC-type amino acid transport substrate-binding protein
VQFGGDGDAYLRRAKRDRIATDALAERTLEDAMARVRSGTADAVLLARADAMRIAPEAAFVLIEPEPYAIAVAAHNTRLLAEIDAALNRIEQSGELAAITRRWLEQR